VREKESPGGEEKETKERKKKEEISLATFDPREKENPLLRW